MKKYFCTLFTLLYAISGTLTLAAQDKKHSGFPELDAWAQNTGNVKYYEIGYPGNQNILLKEFYEWYLANDLELIGMNNAGDPFNDNPARLSTHKFEREVIDFFAPLYAFDADNYWGIVTNSGTDGNNHGIYFGANYLYNKTGKKPVLYVSDEAHYSNMRLGDLQNLDIRLIKSDDMGRMIPEELERALDLTRPVLIVYAMGSTFKGAIDNQQQLNAVLAQHPQLEVYRHIDAALFGGYLPFTKYKNMVSRAHLNYQSIAVSGHKFFGMDEPAGLFLCTREVYDNQAQFNIAYLNQDMKMINCSRSALDALKFWWLIKHVGQAEWSKQANARMANTQYLYDQLRKMDYPCWLNEYSNTVFLKRPGAEILTKYHLACSSDERFGGDLAHIVVMQHVTRERIDAFIADLKASLK